MRHASEIHLYERDYFLNLSVEDWPTTELKLYREDYQEVQRTKRGQWMADPWQPLLPKGLSGGFLWRKLYKIPLDTGTIQPKLHESVVRFPTAPIFGSQYKWDYQYRLIPEHRHTIRLLTFPPPGNEAIDRIFLFFNGLNEIEHFGFYYELASLLLGNQPNSACLIYPFPGHLTRYPLVGKYAEKPLQRFIDDPTDLFRQYLRFMIEIQWLLSILVPFEYYPVAPGMPLLAEGRASLPGRSDSKRLGLSIKAAWDAINDYSVDTVNKRCSSAELATIRKSGIPVTADHARQSVEVIRFLIKWEAATKPLEGHPLGAPLPRPRLHVIGYSLGGYLAQSVFFSWPFAVSSCTTICSGGALGDLRPVKVAHEEEWQAITHGLKYELESGMLEGRLRVVQPEEGKCSSVAGVPAQHFTSFFQIFNDVFLQEFHGSYRTRVSEFTSRLLFVVGGNDPIVSTASVVKASPPEGINMIEIANLSHFVAIEGGEWSGFWLPTVTRVISSLSEHTETLHANSVLSNLWNDETTGPLGSWPMEKPWKSLYSTTKHRDPEALNSKELREELMKLVAPLGGGAFLMILRNRIPVTLLGKHLLHQRGAVPHYSDDHIREFWQELQEKQQTMLKFADRITLVLPFRLSEWILRPSVVLSHKPSALARELEYANVPEQIWRSFLEDWESTRSLYCFDAEQKVNLSDGRFKLEYSIREDTGTEPGHPIVNCLPDLWIGFSGAIAEDFAGKEAAREGFHEGFHIFCKDLYDQRSPGAARCQAPTKLEDWLEKGDLTILRASAAESNPRFLGERIRNPSVAADLLIHSSLALIRSSLCVNSGDFGKRGMDC